MSLIFDSFKSRSDAEKFATHVTKTFKRETVVYDSQEAVSYTHLDVYKRQA